MTKLTKKAKMHYENKKLGYIKNDTKNLKLSYYYGFLEGLDEKLEKQNEEWVEEGLALVLQTPIEVKNYFEANCESALKYSDAEKKEYGFVNEEHFASGYKEGKVFSTNIITDERSKNAEA